MKQMIDFNATIHSFFDDAISWLEHRPVRLRDGENKEQKTLEYMKIVQSDPIHNTLNNAVFANCDKLDGFIERRVDKNGNLISNNDLYLAVMRVLDAIGQYYTVNYQYTQSELLKNIKEFRIALNRKNIIKTAFYKTRPLMYFAQKQK